MIEQPQVTKACRKCGETKPLLAYAGRQNTCMSCRDAAKARTLERRSAIAYSPELSEKICDMLAAGISVAEICAQSWAPTDRHLAKWRRTIPEFSEAYEQARQARADARSDRIDATLNDLRAQKITAGDARVIIDSEFKMMGKENPARYGDKSQVDITSAGKALASASDLDIAKALARALAAPALPAPQPIDVEAVPVASNREAA